MIKKISVIFFSLLGVIFINSAFNKPYGKHIVKKINSDVKRHRSIASSITETEIFSIKNKLREYEYDIQDQNKTPSIKSPNAYIMTEHEIISKKELGSIPSHKIKRLHDLGLALILKKNNTKDINGLPAAIDKRTGEVITLTKTINIELKKAIGVDKLREKLTGIKAITKISHYEGLSNFYNIKFRNFYDNIDICEQIKMMIKMKACHFEVIKKHQTPNL